MRVRLYQRSPQAPRWPACPSNLQALVFSERCRGAGSVWPRPRRHEQSIPVPPKGPLDPDKQVGGPTPRKHRCSSAGPAGPRKPRQMCSGFGGHGPLGGNPPEKAPSRPSVGVGPLAARPSRPEPPLRRRSTKGRETREAGPGVGATLAAESNPSAPASCWDLPRAPPIADCGFVEAPNQAGPVTPFSGFVSWARRPSPGVRIHRAAPPGPGPPPTAVNTELPLAGQRSPAARRASHRAGRVRASSTLFPGKRRAIR